MFVHYRTQGIFLEKAARGEADELFTIYARDFGKLEISAKAVRKITSKLRGGAGLFYLSDIEFIQSKARKTLTDAVLIESFQNIRHDLLKLRTACRVAEILSELTPKEEKDEQIWKLLDEVFHKLNNSNLSIAGRQMLYYYFFWNLVSVLGYRPNISGCSIDGREINCDIIKILKLILRRDWRILPRLKIEPVHLRLLKNISEWYNDNIVGR